MGTRSNRFIPTAKKTNKQKKNKQKSQLNQKIDRIVNWAPALSFTRPEKVTTIVHYNCCWKRSSSDLNGTRNILIQQRLLAGKKFEFVNVTVSL